MRKPPSSSSSSSSCSLTHMLSDLNQCTRLTNQTFKSFCYSYKDSLDSERTDRGWKKKKKKTVWMRKETCKKEQQSKEDIQVRKITLWKKKKIKQWQETIIICRPKGNAGSQRCLAGLPSFCSAALPQCVYIRTEWCSCHIMTALTPCLMCVIMPASSF